MQYKCEDEQLQNSYLSSLFYRQVKILKNTVSNTLSVVTSPSLKEKIVRHKTHLSIINDINHDCIQNLKRKNSFIGYKKYRKTNFESMEASCTPYQTRKNHQKLNIKLKKQKLSAKLDHLPQVLEQTKAGWLVVRQAGASSRLKTEPSAERVQLYTETNNDQNSDKNCNNSTISIKQKVQIQSKNEKDRHKSIRMMLSSYKNKNVIKHNLRNNNKTTNVTNNQIKESINLKLSTLSQSNNQTRMTGIKQKIKNSYVSKRQLTLKNKKALDQTIVVTESFVNSNLMKSTHSDLTDKIVKNHLQGVLNSFKVDMKFKQTTRPRTASRINKFSLTNMTKSPKKNASTHVIEMTGWQQEPDRFDRDLFFS